MQLSYNWVREKNTVTKLLVEQKSDTNFCSSQYRFCEFIFVLQEHEHNVNTLSRKSVVVWWRNFWYQGCYIQYQGKSESPEHSGLLADKDEQSKQENLPCHKKTPRVWQIQSSRTSIFELLNSLPQKQAQGYCGMTALRKRVRERRERESNALNQQSFFS